MGPELSQGDWNGFWTYFDNPQRHPMKLTVSEGAGSFTAVGEDEVGAFRMSKDPQGTPGDLTLLKQYEKHEVRYVLRWTGSGFAGRWYLQDYCGGSVLLWSGASPEPPPGLSAFLPEVTFISKATRRNVFILDWGLLMAGVVGLVTFSWLADSRMKVYLILFLFWIYMWCIGQVQYWVRRRVTRQALGPWADHPDAQMPAKKESWKRRVTLRDLVETGLTVGGTICALWLAQLKG